MGTGRAPRSIISRDGRDCFTAARLSGHEDTAMRARILDQVIRRAGEIDATAPGSAPAPEFAPAPAPRHRLRLRWSLRHTHLPPQLPLKAQNPKSRASVRPRCRAQQTFQAGQLIRGLRHPRRLTFDRLVSLRSTRWVFPQPSGRRSALPDRRGEAPAYPHEAAPPPRPTPAPLVSTRRSLDCPPSARPTPKNWKLARLHGARLLYLLPNSL